MNMVNPGDNNTGVNVNNTGNNSPMTIINNLPLRETAPKRDWVQIAQIFVALLIVVAGTVGAYYEFRKTDSENSVSVAPPPTITPGSPAPVSPSQPLEQRNEQRNVFNPNGSRGSKITVIQTQPASAQFNEFNIGKGDEVHVKQKVDGEISSEQHNVFKPNGSGESKITVVQEPAKPKQ